MEIIKGLKKLIQNVGGKKIHMIITWKPYRTSSKHWQAKGWLSYYRWKGNCCVRWVLVNQSTFTWKIMKDHEIVHEEMFFNYKIKQSNKKITQKISLVKVWRNQCQQNNNNNNSCINQLVSCCVNNSHSKMVITIITCNIFVVSPLVYQNIVNGNLKFSLFLEALDLIITNLYSNKQLFSIGLPKSMVSLANLEWSWRKIIVDHLSFSRNMGHTIVLYQLCVEVVVFLLVVGVASKLCEGVVFFNVLWKR